MTNDLTGHTLGDFRVVRRLGAGGMGEVYLARQLSLKRDVALKLLRPDLLADPVAVQRFQQEAEAAARLVHANIVQVYAVGEADGRRFMALEYVDGRTLRDLVEKRGPLPAAQAVAVLRQALAALARAGDAGLVHRDVKPDNLLLARTGELKVADFGLSRVLAGDDPKPVHLTASGTTLGTPLYMSPEQVRGEPADHRSDLYSLGVTAYHLLAGRPPFTGKTPFDVAVQHVQADPPPLAHIRADLPPPLVAFVHRLMAKDPAARPASARAALAELDDGPGPRPAGRRRRGGLVGTAAVLAGGAGWWLAGPTRVHAPVGLPEVRPPEPVTSAHERELLAVTRDRAASPAAVFEAAVALGLLYVGERRLTEAERVFAEVEAGKHDRPGGARPTQFVGRLGRAVVAAHQDRARDAEGLFDRAFDGLARQTGQFQAERVLLAHPDLLRAAAGAVDRLPAPPPRLEWLRSPAAVLKGPRP